MTLPLRSLAAVLMALTLCPSVAAAELTVDLVAPFKPVDHLASGSLYGLAAAGWPPDPWIAAIVPNNITQMAPGGGQLPS